jgi:hypothetical protein
MTVKYTFYEGMKLHGIISNYEVNIISGRINLFKPGLGMNENQDRFTTEFKLTIKIKSFQK